MKFYSDILILSSSLTEENNENIISICSNENDFSKISECDEKLK